MDSKQQPPEEPPEPPTQQSVKRHVSLHFQNKLVEFGVIVGPSLFVVTIFQVLQCGPLVTAIAGVLAGTITVAIYISPFISRNLKPFIRMLTILGTTTLFVALAVVSYLLITRPVREIPIPCEAGVPGSITSDPWSTWEQNVIKEVKACALPDDGCVALAISKQKYPLTASSALFSIEHLEADVRAGSVLMKIPAVLEMLNRRVGIKAHFLGDGFAQQNAKGKQYWDAQVPEYLIRNHAETDPNLWTWSLDPDYKYLDKKLMDVIGSEEGLIKQSSGRSHTEFLTSIRIRLGLGDEDPPVIRFQRFPLKDPQGNPVYSGRIGRPGAKRVFVLKLGAVDDLTLRKAAELSGYSLETPTGKEDRFWIWVYLPKQGELEKPTWSYIIQNVKDWLGEP